MNPIADRYYFIIHQRKGNRLYSEVRDTSTNQVVFSDTRFEDRWLSDGELVERFEQKVEEVIF
jgi:hypothetical protein